MAEKSRTKSPGKRQPTEPHHELSGLYVALAIDDDGREKLMAYSSFEGLTPLICQSRSYLPEIERRAREMTFKNSHTFRIVRFERGRVVDLKGSQ